MKNFNVVNQSSLSNLSTNLSTIISMAISTGAQMSDSAHAKNSQKKSSQISQGSDHKSMEKVRNSDLFSKSRDLINDLVFDPWSTKKAVQLRETLNSMSTAPDLVDDKDNAIAVVMERVERLAALRVRADKAAKNNMDADSMMNHLSKGHDGVIHLIESCFKV